MSVFGTLRTWSERPLRRDGSAPRAGDADDATFGTSTASASDVCGAISWSPTSAEPQESLVNATDSGKRFAALTSNVSLFQRVLVVEDDPLLRWCIAETVARDGHSVSASTDTASAFAALRAGPFDVILVSHPLPSSDAFTLLAHCQHFLPSTAAVWMPVFDERKDTLRARKLGAVGVLKKPFDLFALHRAVFDAAGV